MCESAAEEREEGERERKNKKKREKEKKKKRKKEKERKRRRKSRQRPRLDAHVRRLGVTRGTRENRETGLRLDSDVGTGI